MNGVLGQLVFHVKRSPNPRLRVAIIEMHTVEMWTLLAEVLIVILNINVSFSPRETIMTMNTIKDRCDIE